MRSASTRGNPGEDPVQRRRARGLRAGGQAACRRLYSEGTPFPRYLLGDHTRLTTKRCGCGLATARAVGGMYGRMDDMLSLRGAHVHLSAIEDVIRRIPECALEVKVGAELLP
jgi:phenylacetate-coenzyme A ligase PaaK-like adenylate-forming protein